MSSRKVLSSDLIFGAALRSIRKYLGLTQIKFAEPLSISGSYVSNLEKSEATPSEAVIREIVSVYRINRNYLETGKGEMFYLVPLTSEKFRQFTTNKESIGRQELIDKYPHLAIEIREPNDEQDNYTTPYISKIVTMLKEMDEDTQKDICLSVEKEKLLRELLRQQEEKKAG